MNILLRIHLLLMLIYVDESQNFQNDLLLLILFVVVALRIYGILHKCDGALWLSWVWWKIIKANNNKKNVIIICWLEKYYARNIINLKSINKFSCDQHTIYTHEVFFSLFSCDVVAYILLFFLYFFMLLLLRMKILLLFLLWLNEKQ